MNYQITIEGRKSLAQIQKDFSDKLSEKQILLGTAQALNKCAAMTQSHIKREVKKAYTVNSKYLNRWTYIGHKAKGNADGLYTEVKFSYRPVPMIGFKHTGVKGKKGTGINVTIKKGKTVNLKHAFIASMKNVSKQNEISEHEGIYGAGRYTSGKFVYDGSRTASGKQRITEFKTASPFTMSTTKEMQASITTFVNADLPGRVKTYLERRVDAIKRGYIK